jgi:hypothetical protein
VAPGSIRSVAGTVDIGLADAGLDHADEAIGALFDESLKRPLLVRDERPPYRAPKPSRRGRRRG